MNNKILIAISLMTLLFCGAIAWDVSPFLRGPAPYPPDWRWEYLFVNTVPKVWVPLFLGIFILFFVQKVENLSEKQIVKHEKILLTLCVLLLFCLQFAVSFFSRAGVGVLLHRIINPDLNGYFTAALSIKNMYTFLHGYENVVLYLPQHAQGHPPGAILFFWIIEQCIQPFSSYLGFLQYMHIEHTDVFLVWNGLTIAQKATALFSGFFICFLSATTIIYIYYIAKNIYNAKSAMRAVFLYTTIPSILLFIPINDVFLPIFSMSSFLLFILGIKKEKKYLLFLSGLIFSIGLFFSLSLLPVLFVFFVFLIMQSRNMKQIIVFGILFTLGLTTLPIFLFLFFGYNTLEVSKTLMSGLPSLRKYQVWVFYDLYDFFVFSGIPLLLLFLILLFSLFKEIQKNHSKKTEIVTIGFIGMLFLLDISGSVRGEVGRIWLPFYSFLVLIISFFITNTLKWSTKAFLVLICLQFIQVLVMQEAWVMLW
jgi:hypothetical protein